MSNIIGKIKGQVIDKTSDILSFPTRARYARQARQANADAKMIKDANAIKGKPIEPADESNPDFRTHVNAIGAKFRIEQRANRYARKALKK